MIVDKSVQDKRPYPNLFHLRNVKSPPSSPIVSHSNRKKNTNHHDANTASSPAGPVVPFSITEKIWYLAATLEYQLPGSFDGLCGDILGTFDSL